MELSNNYNQDLPQSPQQKQYRHNFPNEFIDKLHINTKKFTKSDIDTYKAHHIVNNSLMTISDQHNPNLQFKTIHENHHLHQNLNNSKIIPKKSKIKPNLKSNIKDGIGSNKSSLSSSNASSKKFQELSNRKMSIKQLDWLNYFGITILTTMIIILSILSLLLKNNISKYSLYVNCSDYSNIMITSIAIYRQYLIQNIIIPNDSILDSTNNTIILSKSILPQMYQLYKENFENAIFTQQIFDNSYTLQYNDYEMQLRYYLPDNDTIILLQSPYYYSILFMMDTLYNVNETNTTIDYYSQFLFIFENFPQYFKVLMQNTWDIGDEAYGLDSQIDIENFAINTLICCLIATFLFVLLIYPIFYSIETKQKQGTSLYSTISTSEIVKINVLIQDFLGYFLKKDRKNFSKKKSTMTNIKSIRQWQYKRFNCIIFIAILCVFYGLWSTFFAINATTVIKQNMSFKQYYYEYDFITDASSSVHTKFFMIWLALWINNHNTYQDFFLNNYELPNSIFEDSISDFTAFWMNIDDYIGNNTQMTDFYRNTHLYIKENDICIYIKSYLKDEEDLQKCQTSLNNAMRNGILKAILMLSESLVKSTTISMEEDLNQTKLIQALNSPYFKGASEIQMYIFDFFQQYVYYLKLNLNTVLDNNLKSTEMFLGLGIFMFIASFWIFWIPFVYHLRKELNYVKRIYCCLPALTIMQNPYIKKWLNDNTLNS